MADEDKIKRISASDQVFEALQSQISSGVWKVGDRLPSEGELAERCGVSVEDAAVSLDALSPVTSLSDFVYGEDTVTYEGVLSDGESERETERICDRVALAQSIGHMPPLWRRIVLLRYYRNLTQQQVAQRLGLTQVKVSREEKKILAFLRQELS